MKTASQGFTLIELVVVIIVLGILAAAAIPKFINLEADARISTVNAMRSAVATGAMLARSKAIIIGADVTSSTSINVDLDGAAPFERLVYGYPDSQNKHTMEWIIDQMGDFKYKPGAPGQYQLATDCLVEYTNAVDANSAPQITVTTSGC